MPFVIFIQYIIHPS